MSTAQPGINSPTESFVDTWTNKTTYNQSSTDHELSFVSGVPCKGLTFSENLL